MRTNHILILLFMICLLLVAAGCTRIPGALPASSGTASPTFTGKWMTIWQADVHDIPMTLTQTGTAVAGTYDHNSGTITGTVTGTTLTGLWTEDNGQSKGPIEFVISADGKTFAGWWGYETDDFAAIKKEAPAWTGKRV